MSICKRAARGQRVLTLGMSGASSPFHERLPPSEQSARGSHYNASRYDWSRCSKQHRRVHMTHMILTLTQNGRSGYSGKAENINRHRHSKALLDHASMSVWLLPIFVGLGGGRKIKHPKDLYKRFSWRSLHR
jgi:hypothetical protein